MRDANITKLLQLGDALLKRVALLRRAENGKMCYVQHLNVQQMFIHAI